MASVGRVLDPQGPLRRTGRAFRSPWRALEGAGHGTDADGLKYLAVVTRTNTCDRTSLAFRRRITILFRCMSGCTRYDSISPMTLDMHFGKKRGGEMERDGLATTVSRLSTPTFRTTRQPRPH